MLTSMAEDDGDLMRLVDRIGRTHLQQRVHMQVHHAAEVFGPGRAFFNFDNAQPLNVVLRLGLKLCGLYGRGHRNFQNIQINHSEVSIPRLPPAFAGFTLLHLSDLHLDLDSCLTSVIAQRLKGLQYDVCLITGDFRNAHHGDFDPCLEQMRLLMPHLNRPTYGILGNHDFLEMVHPLEEMGVRMLLNETVRLERDGETIYLSGVDDPYFYETDNMDKARQGIPPEATSLLMAHSPGSYRKAAAVGYDLMLSGHTHGGQICLPGGIPILRIGNCPARMLSGSWSYQGMAGYTSVGTGSCGVPVRFHCLPEIALHHLNRGPHF
jgi:predicted MPP superfamily phosphohydrolase